MADKKWIARVVQETELDIIVWTDGEPPTKEDVEDAMCYADSLNDSFVISQKIVEAESYETGEDGEPEIVTFTGEETEDE